MPHIKNALFRYRIIDKALRNEFNPYPSKAKLREACEEALFGSVNGDNICDSTIEKDMFAMKMEHDAPIKYSKKFNGYYYTDSTYSLAEIPLNASDLEAIRFAANTLSQFKDVAMFKQFGFAIDKIIDRVTVSNELPLQEDEQFVEFESAISTRGNEYLSPLLLAIKQKQIVFFEYESFQSQQRKPRKVLPLFLKEYRNRWYVLTYDLVQEKIITFALDRIYNFQDSSETFSKKIPFNSKHFFEHSIGITASEGTPLKIRFEANQISSKYIESQPFHKSQVVIRSSPNSVLFEMEVYVSEELIRTLLSYGGEIKVIEPSSLVDELIKRTRLMAENYGIVKGNK
ncbi:MAG TPA: WYL domain-containing protein [Fluviicola sp.]|nr:WYL domain-containing protein [Fluviicola sp.]